jgi:hypothetical protein
MIGLETKQPVLHVGGIATDLFVFKTPFEEMVEGDAGTSLRLGSQRAAVCLSALWPPCTSSEGIWS